MPLPNFFIIGSGRSGTTSLYYYLKQHPDVYMSPVKEPNFYYLNSQQQKLRGTGTRGWLKTSVGSRAGYESLFDGVTSESAVGEASVRYLTDENVPAAIRADVPDARLFAVLRHPVERVYSSYIGLRMAGREKAASIQEALDLEEFRMAENWSFGQYRRSGLYGKAIKRWYRHFDPRQLQIFLFDDFRKNPAEVVRAIYQRLGVDGDFTPDTSVRHNPTGVIRNPIARVIWANSLPVRAALRNHLPKSIRDLAFPLFTRSGVYKPPIPGDVRAELMDYFRPDILELQDLIKRDLGCWLN